MTHTSLYLWTFLKVWCGHFRIKDPFRNVMKAKDTFFPKCTYQRKFVCNFWASQTSPKVYLQPFQSTLRFKVTNHMTIPVLLTSQIFMTVFLFKITRFIFRGSLTEIRVNEETAYCYLWTALLLLFTDFSSHESVCKVTWDMGCQKWPFCASGRITRQ